MRSLRLFSVLLLLAFLVACPTLWEEEKEDDPQPVPPTITGHEFESSNSIDNEHVSIRLHYEGAVSSTVELHRSAPDDGYPEFRHMTNIGQSPGDYLDDGHSGRPYWGRRYIYRMGVYANSGDLVWSESDDYVVETPPFLPPENVAATLDETGNTITVTWDPCDIEHDVTYRVYRATYDVDPSEIRDHDFRSIDDVSTTSYRDDDVSPGTRYAYTVTTICNEWGQTPRSAVAVLGAGGGDVVTVPVPEGLTAEEMDAGDGILISWEAVARADAYKVYRATGGSDASYSAISDWLEDGLPTSGAVSYTDTTAVYGTTYHYRVTARANEVESEQSAYVQGNLGTAGAAPPKPENVTAEQFYQGTHIAVQWDAVPGATRYRVYRLASTATADPADIDSYTQVHETAVESNPEWNDVRDDSHDVARLYYYRVSALTDHGESVSDDWGEGFFGSELTKPSRPTESLTATQDSYSNAIVVSWDAVPDAAFYRVYSRGGSHVYIEATEEFAVSDWITGTQFVHMTAGDGNDQAYYKIQARHAWGGVSYVSVGFMGSVDPTAPAYTADDGDGDGDGGDDGGGGSGSWVTLGTDGFASASAELAMAAVGSTLYVGFPDKTDANNRIKVMSNDGSASGSWNAVGGHLSLDAVEWDDLTLSEIGGDLYTGYADTDDSVTSGGSSRVFVKKLVGSSWSTIGDSSFGHRPRLTGNATDLYLVYPGSSSGLLESRKYAGSGTTWNEYDTAYWFDNVISSLRIALDLDGSGNPVVAVRSGQIDLNFYRNAGSWAPHLTTFTPSTGLYELELYGFRHDNGGTPYTAYSNHHESGHQASCGLAKWNGSGWEELDLLAQIGISEGSVHDVAMIPAASGNGVLVAAGYRDGTALRVELWHYDGSAWQQVGPDISAGTRDPDIYPSLSVAVQYDGSGNPVVVFSDDESGSIRARGFRE